jgi:DNA-binding response OmpR family regulator
MKKLILLADDDPRVTETLGEFLRVKGYEVCVAATGKDAVREIIARKPDLVLLDVNMPKLDGLSTLDFMKTSGIGGSVPVIILSGEWDSDTVSKAAKLGAVHCIHKSTPFGQIEEAIADVMKKK